MSTGKANDEKKVSSGGRVSVNWAKRKFLAASSRPSPSAIKEYKVSDRQPPTMPLKKSRHTEVIAVEGVDGSKMPPLKKRRKQKKQQKRSSKEKINTKEEKSMKSSSIGVKHNNSVEVKLAKKGKAAAVGHKKRKADGGDEDLPPKEKKTRVGVAADVDASAGSMKMKMSPPPKEKTLVSSSSDRQSIEKKPNVCSTDGCTDLVLKSGACTKHHGAAAQVVKKSSSREGGICGNNVQLGLAIALCAGVRLIGLRSQDILQSTGYNTPLALDVKGHWNNAVRGPTGMMSNVVDTKTLLHNKLKLLTAKNADTTEYDDIGANSGGKSFKDWRMGIKKRAQKGIVGFRKGYVDLVEKNDFFL